MKHHVTFAVALAAAVSACSDGTARVTSPASVQSGPSPTATVIGADGNPTPSGNDRILLDTRTSLQQAGSLTAAWALFAGNDHSAARTTADGTGWSFATNFDGNGTHALRADWRGTPGTCPSPNVRLGDQLPTPYPTSLYVQWQQYLGRTPSDTAGNGAADSFLVTNSACPNTGRRELRVFSDTGSRTVDHQWVGSAGAQPRFLTAGGRVPGNQGWSFFPEQNAGRPITITVYIQGESASGAHDGVVRMWIDGKLFIDRSGQSLGATAFRLLRFPTSFGGPPQSESEYFWNIVAWQPTAAAPPPPAPVKSVTVTLAASQLNPGQTTTATATLEDSSGNVLSGRSISWTSSNTSVATVAASGASTATVTSVGAGTADIIATSEGVSGQATLTVTSAPPPPPPGCANPQPGWIWCDDFEADHTSSYFEYTNPGGNSFTRQAGGGLNGSTSMRARWSTGQVDAGSLKLAFGQNPSSYMRPVDAGTATYREIYWRVYVRSQAGWMPNGNDKFTRAIVFARDDWSEAAIGHVWGGSGSTSQNYYVLDPVSGVDASGNVVTSGYNDFAHFTWLGAVQGQVPVFGSGAGQWYCVEAHMKLNDPGQTNGVLEEWINGTLDAQATGLNFVGTYMTYGINALFLEGYINNGAPQAQVRDFDDYVVSTQRVGCQ